MLRYYSTKPPVSFSEQFKEILTEYSRIAGKVGHSKTKNIIQYKL